MDRGILVQNIKKHCDLRGIKPTVACRESGAGKDLINQIEKKGSVPSVEKIYRLANYFGVTTSELLGESLPTSSVTHKEQLQAALWGDDTDLTQEEKDVMWRDVEQFAAFLAQQMKQTKQKKD